MCTTVRIVKTPDVLHWKPRSRARIGVFRIGELVREQDWSGDRVLEQFELDEEGLRPRSDTTTSIPS